MHEHRTIHCLLVDDEPPAREIIRRYIDEVPMLELAGECGNAIEAMSFIQQNPVDLIFLDIRLPQVNGNDLLKILKHPPRVIFTTAHAEYALEGYELDVVDYLLKPIQFDRFLKAVHRATQTVYTEPLAPPAQKQEAFVYFRSERKMVKVMLQDILFIESMKDYIKVVTTSGAIVTKQSISSVEEMLPEHLFMRTHRSFIVSLSRISSYTSELLEIDKKEIPIGKLFRNEVLKKIASSNEF
ncbi:MAG: LytR/AlgR family response regulator transcription factor [Flavisolibacter sp.]